MGNTYSITTIWDGNEKTKKFTFKKFLETEIRKWWKDIKLPDEIKLIILNADRTESSKEIEVKRMDFYETWLECDERMKQDGIPKSFIAKIVKLERISYNDERMPVQGYLTEYDQISARTKRQMWYY